MPPQNLTKKRVSARQKQSQKVPCSVTVVGIANSVELFKGEIGNDGKIKTIEDSGKKGQNSKTLRDSSIIQ